MLRLMHTYFEDALHGFDLSLVFQVFEEEGERGGSLLVENISFNLPGEEQELLGARRLLEDRKY